VLLSKGKKELCYRAGLIDRLGRRYGMDIIVTECKLMRVSRQATPVLNYDRSKTTVECGVFHVVVYLYTK